jgi:nondiscriminating glutamyl-tRNA synthetase
MSTPRVRLAPSPTGNFHIGTLRAGLFNWLFARHFGGVFVLRIEDTDTARSFSHFEENIIEGLDWMGLTPQEGPIQGGPFGPYRQSERMKTGEYLKVAQQLLKSGHAYLCFCSEEELDAGRKAADAAHKPYVYPRTCAHLSPEEVQEKLDQKIPYTIRFRLPDQKICQFEDLIRGKIEFDMQLLSDFVMIKSDQSPSYNFAVVVDDLAMQITHVIRGEDHISNTPRQIAVFEALGVHPPLFAHLPMILGTDRSKLSKRHGATSVSDYKAQGFLPQALLNYLVLLGWSSPDGKEIMSRAEMSEKFTLDRVSKSGAIFDIAKLKWMNGQYIRTLDPHALHTALWPFLTEDQQHILLPKGEAYITQALFSLRDNLDLLSDIQAHIGVYLRSEADFQSELTQLKPLSPADETVLVALEAWLVAHPQSSTPQEMAQALEEVVAQVGLGKGKVFKPIRWAVSGQGSGPNLPEFLSILPKETLISRIQFARTTF